MTDTQSSRWPRFRVWLVAAILALLYGISLYLLMEYADPKYGLLRLAFLLGVPIAAPSLAVIILDPHGRHDTGQHIGIGIAIVTAMLIAGVVFLKEGGICILMASPFFYAIGALGPALTGMLLRRISTRVLSPCLVLLPIAALPIDNPDKYRARDELVTTVVDISAPTAVVWQNLTEVRNIRSNELRWTFTQDLVGVPKPEDAKLTGHGVGAIRQVTWGRGIHFEERITKWQENKVLAWHFHFGPASIPHEIEGHIKLNGFYLKVEDGSYRLTPLSASRTRLVLTTHYWMHTAFNSYCAWWGHIFIEDFHRNVLNVIRERAEKSVAQT